MAVPPDQFEDGARGHFCTTHWSVVLAAGNTNQEQNERAMEELCRAYWDPLYAFVRRRGHTPHDAEDLTQAFFQKLIQKNYVAAADRNRGRFRTFLLTALDHFLANEWDRARAQKRGGGQIVFTIDALTAEKNYQAAIADPIDAATLFERRWVATLLDLVLSRLEREYNDRGQGKAFSVLKTFLTGDRGELSGAEAGRQLDLSENAVKQAVLRLRRRYRALFREEVSRLVTDPAEVDDEIAHILALAGR